MAKPVKPPKPDRVPKGREHAGSATPFEPFAAVAPASAGDPMRRRLVSARRLLDRLGGAKLCYGEPVRAGERTVIPVARLRASGGGGFGSGSGDDEGGTGSGAGGGGGGHVDALPIGFIEIGPEGSRFERIEDPEATTRLLKAGASAIVTVATTLAGLRAVRGRRGLPAPRRALGRGR